VLFLGTQFPSTWENTMIHEEQNASTTPKIEVDSDWKAEAKAEKERLDHLSLISDVYAELVDEKSGVVNAEITTAAPLDPGQVAQLEKSLHEATGGEVRISRKTDPQLLGGVVTQIGDVVYDGSLQGQLARIRELLEST